MITKPLYKGYLILHLSDHVFDQGLITVDAGYKNTGYKNISVLRTIVCDPFLSFPIEKIPVIRTYRI